MERIKTSGLMAIVAACGVATAQAEVMLPSGAQDVRLDGVAAFDTSGDPIINVSTGQLVLGGDTPVLTALGEVTQIVDSADTNSMGSVGGELTFLLKDATLNPIGASTFAVDGFGVPVFDLSQAVAVTYTISSAVTNATLLMWDGPTDNPALNLNTGGLVGGPLGDPGDVETNFPAAVDGDLYIEASIDAATAVIVIQFTRPDTSSDFDALVVQLQSLTAGEFDINDGSILDEFPAAKGTSITATQSGQFALSGADFVPDGDNSPSIDQLVAGSFGATIHVPEPGSLALLGAGSALLMTGIRRRNRV